MTFETARAALTEFDLEQRSDVLIARRRRTLPSRGIFRLLIPRVVLHVSPARSFSIRPDALAWFMLVMCAGGVIVELTMDRVRYPREYPPWFIFGLAAFYVAALGFEYHQTKRAARLALSPTLSPAGRGGTG